MPRDTNDEMRKSMIFHIRYHPKNPPSIALQHAWHTHVATPPTNHPLQEVTNHNVTECNVERMIIAHNRPFNLGSLLSYRNLKPNSDPPVSSRLVLSVTRDWRAVLLLLLLSLLLLLLLLLFLSREYTITQHAQPLRIQPPIHTFEARGRAPPSPSLPPRLLTSLTDVLHF
jgi:hypothetical protein